MSYHGMWRPRDSLKESVLSFNNGALGIELQVLRLAPLPSDPSFAESLTDVVSFRELQSTPLT